MKHLKANVALTVLLCLGLFVYVLGASGYANLLDIFGGYDASVPYGSSASFTVTLPYNSKASFSWSGPGTWTYSFNNPISSTFISNPALAPNVYTATCYYQGIPTGSQTFTWIVNALPDPTPTPNPTATPFGQTPTPYFPTSTPTPIAYYSLITSVSGYGGVSISPFLSQYPSNSAITLTANAYAGWHFDHWQETIPFNGALYQNPLSFNIDANYAFQAVFVLDPLPNQTPTATASPSNPNPTATPHPYSVTAGPYTIRNNQYPVLSPSYDGETRTLTFITQGTISVTPPDAAPSSVTVNGQSFYATFYNPIQKDFSMNNLPANAYVQLVFPSQPSPTSSNLQPSPSGSTEPTATPEPTPTLEPPASLPPGYNQPNQAAFRADQYTQVIGLAIAVLSGIAYIPVNGLLGNKRK